VNCCALGGRATTREAQHDQPPRFQLILRVVTLPTNTVRAFGVPSEPLIYHDAMTCKEAAMARLSSNKSD
jgi:hypothetical protein